MKRILSFLLLAALWLPLMADEGMWIPMLLQRNEADMQAAGMRISAKDIYDINQACLKDAIILFNQGCTGEFVSQEGLFLTNHHCGYSYIVKHSTVEHDYLSQGFWAMSRQEELPCPGLTATRLVRMEDVTSQVLEGITDDTPEKDRQRVVEQRMRSIGEAAVKGTHYDYVIKPFYYGNQYFMYINEVFTDVRLVGAPPSNIGKFGGDTDNWMWPRHTGDFSMFRVYADKDNRPAPYSKDNRPYRPLKHLEISLHGVQEGDFTFVFGYPGTTNRYAFSEAVAMAVEDQDPIAIACRDIRLRHYKAAMEQSPAQRLRYASQVASIANGWKKWQGEVEGIQRLKGVEQKRQQEEWFYNKALDMGRYANLPLLLQQQYQTLRPIRRKQVLLSEGVLASDFMNIAHRIRALRGLNAPADEIEARLSSLRQRVEAYYNDAERHLPVDRAIFEETLHYLALQGYPLGHEGVWDKSAISHPDKMRRLLSKGNIKALLNDPAVALIDRAFATLYADDDTQKATLAKQEIDRLMRLYVKAQMEMLPDQQPGCQPGVSKPRFFPDANLTLRVAYGHVQGFHPRDAVYYKPYSTLEGILQKENPDIYDYVVEPRLKALYRTKDYGPYANPQGEMPVAFIATNHTTGGNSGSPVLNADGQLIGINFDRCWEGTMSDLLFDPNYCRNISLDIRYCLFIIDKFAGAKHLVDEMTLAQ